MSRNRERPACAAVCWAVAAALWIFLPGATAGQVTPQTAAAWGGGALGAYSGATLGLVAALGPCSLTLEGTRCARVAAGLGLAIGGISGATIGHQGADALDGRLLGAGLGAVAGAALGVGSRLVIPQIGWQDIVATAAVGAALGTAPLGSATGLGVGIALGSALWLAVPGYGLPEAAVLSSLGVAIGGLAEWVLGAIDGTGTTPFAAQLRVGF